jgi:hypothetical protein
LPRVSAPKVRLWQRLRIEVTKTGQTFHNCRQKLGRAFEKAKANAR